MYFTVCDRKECREANSETHSDEFEYYWSDTQSVGNLISLWGHSLQCGVPAPTWCLTLPVLCRAAFRGTGFQALGTSVETEIEADAIAKPPGSAEIIPHPRSSLCSSPTAAAQPPKSWFPTGVLQLGVISAESTCDSFLELQIRERGMARCQPGSGRAVYFSGWDHST